MEILADHRHGEIFTFIEGLLEEGYDLGEFYRGLVDQLRTLLRLRLAGTSAGLEIRSDLVERMDGKIDAVVQDTSNLNARLSGHQERIEGLHQQVYNNPRRKK